MVLRSSTYFFIVHSVRICNIFVSKPGLQVGQLDVAVPNELAPSKKLNDLCHVIMAKPNTLATTFRFCLGNYKQLGRQNNDR